MATFLEGVEAISQACTLVVLLPGIALAVVARRGRATIAVCFTSAASLLMWAQAAGYWTITSRGGIVVLIGLAIVATFLGAASAQRPDQRRLIAAGVVGGAIAGWMWLPCVGTQLGDVVNNAATDGPRTLWLMLVYTAGALLPVLLIAVLPQALPSTKRVIDHTAVHRIGLMFGAIYAITVALGRYDDIIGELYRISSG